jgi:hypothetical protein
MVSGFLFRVKRDTYYEDEFFMMAKVSILLVSGTSARGQLRPGTVSEERT